MLFVRFRSQNVRFGTAKNQVLGGMAVTGLCKQSRVRNRWLIGRAGCRRRRFFVGRPVRGINSRLEALRAIVEATKETGSDRGINSLLEALRAIVGATKETGPVRRINSRLEALRAIVGATKETGR